MVDRALVARKMERIGAYLRTMRAPRDPGVAAFRKDEALQSIVLFNLIQSVQACLDIGAHVISDAGWELPGSQAGIFERLAEKKVISRPLAQKMIRMAGFRNRVVHEYEALDMGIVHEVWRKHAKDIETFCAAVARKTGL